MDNYRNFNPNVVPSSPNPPPPPPESVPEFNHQLQQHQRPPAPPPQAQWYPNQNQYQPPLQPPPPPGMQNQYLIPPQHWNPHPSENHAPQGYPPVQYTNQQYPPYNQFVQMNQQQMHPPPYHGNQVHTQPYSAGHQEWQNPNWTHHQGYEHPVQGNSDDWATRARAWAAAKTAMDSQHQQSPFPHGARPELLTQGANVTDPQHLETEPGSHPVAYPHHPHGVENTQQVPPTDRQWNNMPAGAHQYGSANFSSVAFSSGPDNHLHKDASLSDESRTVHQKEVPSSYSSSAGRDVVAHQNQMHFSSYPVPGNALQAGHQLHPITPAVNQADLLSRPFSYHNQNGDLSESPLDFAHRGNGSSIYPHHGQSANHIGVESSATLPINHRWASHLTPVGIYPSATTGPQFDPSMLTPSHVPGQVAPQFATTFPVDAYGASSGDRPKKAAVPNWLKEEIIKKKAIMTTSPHEYRKEETQFEDEIGHQSFVKDDQTESKSVDSSRSAEEDEDEDFVEAARTAAINKEIKRVLTEVLLKVTDDLFDEIATRVLDEDEGITEAALNQPSAKVLLPDKLKGTDSEKYTGKPSSEMPGGLLGLVSYGTDSDDERDEKSTQEQPSKKDESLRNAHSSDEKVDVGIESMENLDAAFSMGANNTDSFGRRGVYESASGIEGSDRKQQNGISSLVTKNNGQDKVQSNQDRTKLTSSHESIIASEKIATENKTSSQSNPVTDAAIDRVKENQSGGRHEEKLLNKGGLDDHNGSKGRKKEVSGTDEKQKDSISRKKSSHSDAKYKTEMERGKREGGRENNKRDQLEDVTSERSRRKHSSNSNRHKKGRSPSPSSRRKRYKTDSSVSGGNNSSDESLDDSERKSRSKRRLRSPSPVRSRKRQVSRSPENRQHRQSSYSVEGSRKKRSRSRSPRRHR